jgi:UDP-2,3-diacylglucosamine pyrophosphatase LpxH
MKTHGLSIDLQPYPLQARHLMISTGQFSSQREQGNRQETLRSPTRFKAIWISDVHLGTLQCRSDRLLELLQLTESESLYLVGDIVDSWELKRRWYWDQSHNEVVQAIFEKANRGTKVVFIPGNHDEPFRKFIGLDLGGIQVRDELIHTTAAGLHMLVLHGDRFDGVVSGAGWLRWCGKALTPTVLALLQKVNNLRGRAGFHYWSLSQYLAMTIKGAPNYLSSFEQALAREARQKGLDGVICGHVHKPEMREIDRVLYCNDGDWVEHQSALVEELSGELRLVSWHDIVVQSDRARLCQELALAEP